MAAAPRERVLPNGATALVVHLRSEPVPIFADDPATQLVTAGAVLCGPRVSPLVIGTEFLGATVGVHFKPGGARPFFDVPASDISERVVSLEDVWGPSARLLREQLVDARSPEARVEILEAALLERACRALESPAALELSLSSFEESTLNSVAEVNRRTGLSPKRLLALFRDEVGLSPKTFWRIRRFRGALRDLEAGVLTGAALAHQHGYFDQAHFLREFKELAGLCPREYLKVRVPGTDHVSVYG